METPASRIAVTLEFTVYTYGQVLPEVELRAQAFFGDEPFELGWIDVTIPDGGPIKVEANVHTPHAD